MPRLSYDLAETRKSLITRLKNWDDQEGWREFYDTYGDLIYRVARASNLTESEAQDVVQDTLVEVAKRMKGFKYDPAIGSFRAWLLNLVRWRIKDRVRKHKKHEAGRAHTRTDATNRTGLLASVPDPASLDLDESWDREWERSVMEAAIERVKRKIPASQYQIFDLYVRKDWPVSKVAKALAVTENQIYLAKSRVSKAIVEEARHLEEKML